MAINIKVKNKIKFPKFDLSEELELIAERIILPEIAGNIQERKDIDGQPYAPLAESTIRQKRKISSRKSSPEHPLIGKDGYLFSSGTYNISKKKKNVIKIDIKSIRKDIARYLQIEGVKSKQYGRRKFNFFGVNTKMERKAIKFLRDRIQRLIKRG